MRWSLLPVAVTEKKEQKAVAWRETSKLKVRPADPAG